MTTTPSTASTMMLRGNSTEQSTPSLPDILEDQGQVVIQFTFTGRHPTDSLPHRRPSRTRTMTVLKLDFSIIDWIRSIRLTNESFRRLGRWLDMYVNSTHLPLETLHQLSVVALMMQWILRDCIQPWIIHQIKEAALLHRPINPVEAVWNLASIEPAALVLYVLPLLTTIFSFCISVTLLLQWQPMDAVVASSLIALLIVECLVPLSIAVCIALCVAQAMTLESMALLLGSVWITSSVCSRCIRVTLSPSTGSMVHHG